MAIDIPFRFESERLLWWVEDVYTVAECAGFIDLIERSSPTLATNNPLYRDQDRVIRDDPGNRCRPVPQVATPSTGTDGSHSPGRTQRSASLLPL